MGDKCRETNKYDQDRKSRHEQIQTRWWFCKVQAIQKSVGGDDVKHSERIEDDKQDQTVHRQCPTVWGGLCLAQMFGKRCTRFSLEFGVSRICFWVVLHSSDGALVRAKMNQFCKFKLRSCQRYFVLDAKWHMSVQAHVWVHLHGFCIDFLCVCKFAGQCGSIDGNLQFVASIPRVWHLFEFSTYTQASPCIASG